MAIPSTLKTATQALSYINANPNISSADLIQIARQMNVEIPNAKSILLYSGTLDATPG